ncbi:Cof-type HAD-IIB family hydrolase [Natronospora cellulosivora (SeqCode)]
MQYKLLVLDLDDTLLNKNHEITEETKKTILKVKEKGVELVIATGRMYCSALPYLKELSVPGAAITYNGAYIKDYLKDELIYHQAVDLKIARVILEEAEKADLYTNIYIDDKLFVEKKNELSDLYTEISDVEAEPVGRLLDFIHTDPTKILFIEKDLEKLKYYKEYFQEEYKGTIAVTRSKDFYLEIMDPAVSKGSAIKKVADKSGISLEEVVAIGDGWNDLEMIKAAGLGVAMGNADEEIKKQADMLAPEHDKEGVSTALKEIFNL